MTVQIYFEDLNDIPADELRIVMDKCIKSSFRVFPPTIGEIRGEWELYHESRPNSVKQLELEDKRPFVPMPPECRARIDAVMKRKGLKTKYRMALQAEATRMMEIK